jgi:hypothetical protein
MLLGSGSPVESASVNLDPREEAHRRADVTKDRTSDDIRELNHTRKRSVSRSDNNTNRFETLNL